MSRLYDRIVTAGAVPPGRQILDEDQTILQDIDGLEVVVLDNVADYYFQTYRPRTVCIRDFPNIAPPFDRFFMEFRVPPTLSQLWNWGSDHCGVFFSVVGATDEWGAAAIEKAESLEVPLDGAHWWTQGVAFAGRGAGRPIGPVAIWWMTADRSGYPIGLTGMLTGWGPRYFAEYQDQVQMLSDLTDSFLFPCLLALSFMHCKNVVITDNQPSRADRRRAEHHGGRPVVTFKTLNIRPMQTILKHEGQIEHTGLKKALHICRGHFATYSEERPLFGRVSGTFWKPMHLRGSAKEGAVVKDYDVKPPAKPGNQPS